MCSLFGLTRQAYYKAIKNHESKVYQQEIVLTMVRDLRKRVKTSRWGGRMILPILKPELQKQDIKLGRDKLFDILRANDMLVAKRKRRFYTTQSHHWLRKYTNLIENLVVTRINQVWVSDITYVEMNERVYYLSLITDVYSQKIVGWSLSVDLRSASSLKALEMAISAQEYIAPNSLIHHSDRGVQYCSGDYTGLLMEKKVIISMSRPACPYENAIAERLNGIIKEEWLKDIKANLTINPQTYLKEIIKVYNEIRPHGSLGQLTPDDVHHKGFLRHKTERVIGKEYRWKKAALKKGQPVNSKNAIGPNDYSSTSCSSAELESASSWYCKIN